MTAPLDLDAIEKRALRHASAPIAYASDVRALLAAVRDRDARIAKLLEYPPASCHGCGGRSDDSDDSVGDLVPCDWCEPTRMLCDNCATPFDEEGEGSGGLHGCGECAARADVRRLEAEIARQAEALDETENAMHVRIRRDYDATVANAWRAEVAKRDTENAALRAALRALVDALPKCDECKTRPGEHIEEGYLYCIEHGHGMRGVEYTQPLRAALELLADSVTKGTP